MEQWVPLTYYDRILAAIAASLGGGALAGAVTELHMRLGLLAGALLATIFVYDALFRNPPRPAPSVQAKGAAVVWHGLLGALLVSLP